MIVLAIHILSTSRQKMFSQTKYMPAIFAALWGLKLVVGIGLDDVLDSATRLTLLYYGLAFELLLSVISGSTYEDFITSIDTTSPALTSWVELTSLSTQQASRIIFDQFLDANNDSQLWTSWMCTVVFALGFGILGQAITRSSKFTSGVVAAMIMGVAWACANGVLDAIWYVAKKRQALLEIGIDTVTLSVATWRFGAAMMVLGVKIYATQDFLPPLPSGSTIISSMIYITMRIFAVVAAELVPMGMYAAALAFNHGRLEVLLGGAFLSRVFLDHLLDIVVTPQPGVKRLMGYTGCAAILSGTAGAWLLLGMPSDRVSSILTVLVALPIDRCCDAASLHVGGRALRQAQGPVFVLAVYWLKAQFNVSELRARQAVDPNIVMDALIENFCTVPTGYAWVCTSLLWCGLCCHFYIEHNKGTLHNKVARDRKEQ